MADSLRYGEPDWNSQPIQPVNGEIMQRPVSDKSYEELRFDQLAARNFSMRDHPRLNSLGRHQDSLGLRNQDVLTVTAGDGDTLGTWKIHDVLLVSSSKFAEAAMKHPTIEKQTRTIRLSTENPDIFERYVKWLYSGFIDTSDHEILIHMYKLGERMLDDKFQDVCYSILRASLRPYTVNQILYILNNVLEHDRLHRLCLSEVGRGIVTGKYNFDRSQLDALFDFMPDLMRAVMDDVAKRSAFGQVHPNKAQPASIFGSSPATATRPPPPPPPVAPTQHQPAVTTTHYTPNIGWHFTSTAPRQPSSATGGSFGTTSSAATGATSGWNSTSAAPHQTAPVSGPSFGATSSTAAAATAPSSTSVLYGPGLFRAPLPQTAHSTTTQTNSAGTFGSNQTDGGDDRAFSSNFLFGPKFPHLQPDLVPAASAAQGFGQLTAQNGVSNNPSASLSSNGQTRNIFGSGKVNIAKTGPTVTFSPSGISRTENSNNVYLRPTDSGPSRPATQGESSTRTPLDLWLGNHSTAKGSSPSTSPHTVTTSAPTSEPHFSHSGLTRPEFAMDGPSSLLSSSDKGKGKEREHDAENVASDTSGDACIQFTPASSEESQHQGPFQDMFISTAPSGSREPESTSSRKATEDGNQRLLYLQGQLKSLEAQNQKRLAEAKRLGETRRPRESSPLPPLSECASTHESDVPNSDDEDCEVASLSDGEMQMLLLDQQQKKRRMMQELENANIAMRSSAATTEATAAQQSPAQRESTIDNDKKEDHEPPTDIPGGAFVASAQAAYDDYQSQLVLLEAQNKKRLQMSRNEKPNAAVSASTASSGQTEAGSSKTPYDWTTNSIFMNVRQPAGSGFGKYADADNSGFGQATSHTDQEGASPFGDGSSFGSQRLLSEMPRSSISGMRVPQRPKFGVPTPLTPLSGIFARRSMSGGTSQKPRPSNN